MSISAPPLRPTVSVSSVARTAPVAKHGSTNAFGTNHTASLGWQVHLHRHAPVLNKARVQVGVTLANNAPTRLYIERARRRPKASPTPSAISQKTPCQEIDSAKGISLPFPA